MTLLIRIGVARGGHRHRRVSGCRCSLLCLQGFQLLAYLLRLAAVLPPARHHPQHTNGNTPCKSGQHHQDHRRLPAGAEEKVDGGVLLVIQRKREEGKKNGCLEQPQEVFHASPL